MFILILEGMTDSLNGVNAETVDADIEDIAAGMGMAEGTVKSRLHYALEHLRAALEAERRGEEKLR